MAAWRWVIQLLTLPTLDAGYCGEFPGVIVWKAGPIALNLLDTILSTVTQSRGCLLSHGGKLA